MIRRSFLLFVLFAARAISGGAQSPDVIRNYISTYKDIAISEMQRTGVPASITLAQGIHETSAGTSDLVLSSNNHFGIKCKSNWTGESVRHDDDAKGECFRKYARAEDSYKDHSDFLKSSTRYATLFQLDPIDYKGWAYGLKKAGYATNPRYPEVLIKLIEDYNLQDYTLLALGKGSPDSIPGMQTTTTAGTKPAATTDPAVANPAPAAIYPDGVFKINDTKVVFARKGTSFYSLAQQYEIDLAKLFDFNEMPVMETLDKDQLIYLQRKRKTGENNFHVVLPGETMHDIAQLEAIREENLRELNFLGEKDRPAPGEKLSLKKKSTTVPKLVLKENYTLVPTAPSTTH